MEKKNWLDTLKEKGAAMRLRLFSRWEQFRDSMRHKRRLVILDADTLEERHSMELTGTNVFTTVIVSIVILIALTTILIAFTPLRGIIPGYVSPELMEQNYTNTQRIDSLEHIVDAQNQMIANIQGMVSGKVMASPQPVETDTASDVKMVYRHSKADSLLRKDIEQRMPKKGKRK